MKEFAFQILSPERIIYQGKVVSLVAPGLEGYLGVMADHAPLLAALTVGEVRITEAERKTFYFAVSGGLLEVDKGDVTLLADAAEKAEEIDAHRAEEAKARAQSRLSRRTREIDVTRAHAALMRALNRLRVASRANGAG